MKYKRCVRTNNCGEICIIIVHNLYVAVSNVLYKKCANIHNIDPSNITCSHIKGFTVYNVWQNSICLFIAVTTYHGNRFTQMLILLGDVYI